VTQLVYYEATINVAAAIEREKEIKSWRRSKKVAMIADSNPTWRDLSAADGFFDPLGRPST